MLADMHMLIDDELDLFLMLMEDEWLPDLQVMQLMVVEGEVEDEFPNVPLEWL